MTNRNNNALTAYTSSSSQYDNTSYIETNDIIGTKVYPSLLNASEGVSANRETREHLPEQVKYDSSEKFENYLENLKKNTRMTLAILCYTLENYYKSLKVR